MLWHSDIRLPDGYRLPSCTVTLSWGSHARGRYFDKVGGSLPHSIPLSDFATVEVETKGRKVLKVVVRGSFDDCDDIVYVLIPRGGNPWFVKTVWLNSKTDTHKTLDRQRYVS